ncbi:hypothetical protein [Conexibacter sp. CPCC 206217]|uniref:hypothetical protein n=1 Tax=Conexibacter sp. CPCC 206217 TaxID=3064574 RepID=UPI0027271B4A|nr:hypothetical protein [Conexibacter sp. CPCC 206217]MDO8211332.1 hypothetical protein [Conexibacter sp. CPCC 206217]
MLPSSDRPHLTTASRLLALAALIAVIAAAIALTSGDTAQSATEPVAAAAAAVPAAEAQPSAAVVAERRQVFAQNFALLRTRASGDIPATAGLDDARIDLGAARRIEPAAATRRASGDDEPEAPDATVWVVPRSDGAQCLLAQMTEAGQGYLCSAPAEAVHGYFLMTMSPDDGHAEIYGLMPDGVDSVDVDLADGTTVTLPVVDNAYMAKFDQMTTSITWEDADGSEHSLAAPAGD